MKVILMGATGFVGAEVLEQLLNHPRIEKITAISRRPLTHTSAKLVVILHDDFSRYDDALMGKLADHGACIWTLGGKQSDLGKPEQFERITHTFTIAFARAVARRAAGRFEFCYLSGMGADPSETAVLPWERLTRHLKGRTEKDLQAIAARHPAFSVHCFRPGGILPRDASAALRLLLAPIVIGVDQLARALLRVALEGSDDAAPAVLSNRAIKSVAGA